MILDLHTHILPGIDDGAKSVEVSAEMLAEIARQQSEPVVLTPHFYPYECSLDDFLKKRTAAYAQLKNVMQEQTPVLVGCEIFLSPLLIKNQNLRRLCISGTDFALIELPFTERLEDKTLRLLEDLRYNHGIKPILAHVERYRFITQSRDMVDTLISCGCMIQVNAESFLTSPLKRHFVFDLLKCSKIDFLGSDCHNMTTRPPNLLRAVDFIVKKRGQQALEKIEKRSEMLYNLSRNNHFSIT
ncbi:MAG TPA: CpsB/CapC family capsule biosynthesis tyrosine phosphatase [Clostridia bacterium]|nr:CpsB/CapC family capsule biosynthesis tyrosine phosphatase [Clostridia bacterium]